MIEDALNYRPKEQVLVDLAKALGFSAADLETNRQGQLTGSQLRQFAFRVAQPAIFAAVWATLPFLLWAGMLAAQKHISFLDGMSMFADRLMHFSDLVEANGKFGAILRIGAVVGGLLVAGYSASRVSLRLFFDLIDGKVQKLEGRVVAREEQTLRPNGRDPIEKFFFNLRNDYYKVSLPAYRALESGSIYFVYVTPRSNQLVSIEPKVDSGEKTSGPPSSAPVSSPAPA